MKKIQYIPFLFLTLILMLASTSCQIFESTGPLPEVEITSVVQDELSDENAVVTFNVMDNGTPLEFAGVSYDFQPDVQLFQNQILLDTDSGEDGLYTVTISDLNPDSIYYFTAFASNSIEYVQSDVASFQLPIAEVPVVPCAFVENQVVDNGFSSTNPSIFDAPGLLGGTNFGFRAEFSSGPTLIIDFKSYPNNGIYLTSSSSQVESSNDLVFIQYRDRIGLNLQPVDFGAEVYVERISNEMLSITFCELTYQVSGFDVKVSGNIIYE